MSLHNDSDGYHQRNTIQSTHGSDDQDNEELRALGYVPSFRREFTNLATISFAFSIMGVCSSVASTFNTPLLLGGPASVVWCWFIGGTNCLALASSISEIVSAYPTCGALYGASARLCPKRYRAKVCSSSPCQEWLNIHLLFRIYRWGGLWAGSTSLVTSLDCRLPKLGWPT